MASKALDDERDVADGRKRKVTWQDRKMEEFWPARRSMTTVRWQDRKMGGKGRRRSTTTMMWQDRDVGLASRMLSKQSYRV